MSGIIDISTINANLSRSSLLRRILSEVPATSLVAVGDASMLMLDRDQPLASVALNNQEHHGVKSCPSKGHHNRAGNKKPSDQARFFACPF